MLVSKYNYIQFTVCSVYACMYIYIYIYRIHYCLIYVYTYNITYIYMHTACTYKFYIEYISNNSIDGYNNNGVCLRACYDYNVHHFSLKLVAPISSISGHPPPGIFCQEAREDYFLL